MSKEHSTQLKFEDSIKNELRAGNLLFIRQPKKSKFSKKRIPTYEPTDKNGGWVYIFLDKKWHRVAYIDSFMKKGILKNREGVRRYTIDIGKWFHEDSDEDSEHEGPIPPKRLNRDYKSVEHAFIAIAAYI